MAGAVHSDNIHTTRPVSLKFHFLYLLIKIYLALLTFNSRTDGCPVLRSVNDISIVLFIYLQQFLMYRNSFEKRRMAVSPLLPGTHSLKLGYLYFCFTPTTQWNTYCLDTGVTLLWPHSKSGRCSQRNARASKSFSNARKRTKHNKQTTHTKM